MSGFLDKVRHAFAVDPMGPAEPTPEQEPGVDWIARQVAKRQLTTPSLIALEMSRPLNWITAQSMHLVEPGVWAVAPRAFYDNYCHFAEFLEKRGSIEHLARRIEDLEAEHERRAKDAGTGHGRDTARVEREIATERPDD